MTDKKTTTKATPFFEKQNTKLMILGGLFMIAGVYLMSGGKSTDPDVFNEKEVYSFTRITIAPILIVLGLIIEVVAIFKKSKS